MIFFEDYWVLFEMANVLIQTLTIHQNVIKINNYKSFYTIPQYMVH